MNEMPVKGERKESTRCGLFHAHVNGVKEIVQSRDGSADFILFDNGSTQVKIYSGYHYSSMYPLEEVALEYPVKALLMDLDGTTVRSEQFWIDMIEQTVATLRGEDTFHFKKDDLPYVSGHSVSEHFRYCIKHYMPKIPLQRAQQLYLDKSREELKKIASGGISACRFLPTRGLKEFLLAVKRQNIKIALVTSGTYEKAWPEISDCFRQLDMGLPEDFYDVIITAGTSLYYGGVGTMGELTAKPHPWLYAEAACVGLGIPYADRAHVVGIEDSSAGILSLRLAGFNAMALSDGNINDAGYAGLCVQSKDTLGEFLPFLIG